MRDRDIVVNRVDGSVDGLVLQAGAVFGDVHVHGVARAGKGDVEGVVVGVRSLLRAQVQAGQELPYRLPGARRPSLAEVYVRQDLGGGVEESGEGSRPEPILDDRGQVVAAHHRPAVRVSVRPPTRTVREALDGDRHVVVTGGPGQGKSTLSLRLAAAIAAHWLSGTSEDGPLGELVVPLRLTARELAAQLALPFPQALAASAHAEYGALLGVSFDAELLAGVVLGRRWLLLIDGLDEVADTGERDKLVTVLAAWGADESSPYRVVLTTRPIGGTALAPLQRVGAVRYELQPFDEEALGRFADTWFGEERRAARFLRQLRTAHLDELVRVPLLATIAAIVFEQHGDRPLPDNQYQLYEAYLRYLRTAHTVRESPFADVCDAVLEHLGRVRVETDRSLVAAAEDWVCRNVPCLAGEWREDLVSYLAAVGPLSRRGDDLRFLHHSFAEHLAATAVARLLPVPFDHEVPEFARLLHAAAPQDAGRHARAVLLHYTRLHPDAADGLIVFLHQGNGTQHLLAARLLAVHTPASTAVTGAFLDTAREWALTTQYPGQDILAQASRATYHPTLSAWLADLAHDIQPPWPTRVEAAAALATRLHGAECHAARALLRTVVDDPAVGVESRLAASEALAECGGPERGAAEAGLRAILADPAATGEPLRMAAVLLASFDGPARTDAISALTTVLDDEWSSDEEVVAAATGLAEISTDHHDRCATAFRNVLTLPVTWPNPRQPLHGLIALGGDYATEAVYALTDIINNGHLRIGQRIGLTTTLAELGPQHRANAAGIAQGLLSPVLPNPNSRWVVCDALAELGAHEQALAMLRTVLHDPTGSANTLRWTARSLADLGPEFREEAARALTRVSSAPDAWEFDWAGSLSDLAELGEPFRIPAIETLRARLEDPSELPEFRIDAAKELAGLGPRFHDDIANHLDDIVSRATDLIVRFKAWGLLHSISSSHRDCVEEAVVEMLTPQRMALYDKFPARLSVGKDLTKSELVRGALAKIPKADNVAGEVRLRVLTSLREIGSRYRKEFIETLDSLIRNPDLPTPRIVSIKSLGSEGVAARNTLARALIELIGSDTDVGALCAALDILHEFGHASKCELVAQVRGRIKFRRSHPRVITTLIATAPELHDEIVTRLFAEPSIPDSTWTRLVDQCAEYNVHLVPRVLQTLLDENCTHGRRRHCAEFIAQRVESKRFEALHELSAQADDEFQDFSTRVDAEVLLASFEPARMEALVAELRAVLHDRQRPVTDRCTAGRHLVRLAPDATDQVTRAIRQMVTTGAAADRADAFEQWLKLWGSRSTQVTDFAFMLTHDPTVPVTTKRESHTWMSAPDKAEYQRELLADRVQHPAARTRGLTRWTSPDLAAEAETVLRDVLAAPETLAKDKVDAAAELPLISRALIPDAIAHLQTLAKTPTVRRRALLRLAELSPSWMDRILTEADTTIANPDASHRCRLSAANLILDLTYGLPDDVEALLRRTLADHLLSPVNQVDMHYQLRVRDGLDPIRRIRDNDNSPAAARHKAANILRRYTPHDRALGAHALHTIATDRQQRPALRWRAANDLLDFGDRGREWGTQALQTLVQDNTLLPTTRAEAGRALGIGRPDLRNSVLSTLRSLSNSIAPLARIRVWHAIGHFNALEAARGLQDIARDVTFPAGARLRAALGMIEFNRNLRETAATTAREIAHDPTCPQHIRHKAARALALLSDLCRREAQTILIELETTRP